LLRGFFISVKLGLTELASLSQTVGQQKLSDEPEAHLPLNDRKIQ